ncbi:3-isopropylmalate dehydratase large subunit [Advenella mimigardefordensis]|uniref:3-isopropylmalate dehydratase n=1 Tax=Advenella mimigardefordensis (strain DSM 17166 / LMG 22922 / DPN7) TaxID=1247726 RepID=W0P6N5_ADVMD|nr:3-isopropylmalate dehydratase large subunit [Advenella mimigardefordensis]AHG62534.1 3-isopropylmalate dehydratase large subunit [Advenella mimigardefordensis DPN7]
MEARTLLDKLWDSHVIQQHENGWALLHIDRQLLHDLSGTASLNALSHRGLGVHNPELVFATPDHAVSSAPGRDAWTYETGGKLWQRLHNLTRQEHIHFFDIGQPGHGIVHVMAPELGLVLPGLTVICGDSHTCTNGALGALAFGVGSSELAHALATQTLKQRKPKSMRIRFEGTLKTGVTAKDLILYTIGRLGVAVGTGYAVEYAGPVIDRLAMEQRMTLCNLSIELGAKMGFIAPDETTFEYIKGSQYAPRGDTWDQACKYWSTLHSDADARFDREVTIDASEVGQMITWGISPEHVIPIDQNIPDIDECVNENVRTARQTAADYMGLALGSSLAGTPVDRIFIGSCTNARLSDLVEAAQVIQGQHIAEHVTAWVVPGSETVKREAQALGLDTVFRDAGFEWREPGCSMCVAANGEIGRPGERIVSTTNRNFVGRQGPAVRTHLASPRVAAACALAGVITGTRGV